MKIPSRSVSSYREKQGKRNAGQWSLHAPLSNKFTSAHLSLNEPEYQYEKLDTWINPTVHIYWTWFKRTNHLRRSIFCRFYGKIIPENTISSFTRCIGAGKIPKYHRIALFWKLICTKRKIVHQIQYINGVQVVTWVKTGNGEGMKTRRNQKHRKRCQNFFKIIKIYTMVSYNYLCLPQTSHGKARSQRNNYCLIRHQTISYIFLWLFRLVFRILIWSLFHVPILYLLLYRRKSLHM